VARRGSTSKGGSGSGGKSRKPAVTGDPESVQPDPRWADQLEKLKQQLLQTANP
jgi:hypothetical protein